MIKSSFDYFSDSVSSPPKLTPPDNKAATEGNTRENVQFYHNVVSFFLFLPPLLPFDFFVKFNKFQMICAWATSVLTTLFNHINFI